jgi:DNA primase
MFPIIDVSGNVIAFGGRVMDDSKPKYKNSSDTPVFKKSRNLFALNFARHVCQEAIILCEGYMDVIALHSAGFENAVATLGTAITSEQARMMSRYTKKVIISYDSDDAGQKAAMRAVKLLSEVGLDVTILKVNGAKDPDEYIKKFGADKFRQLLSQSKSKFDYNLEAILARHDINLQSEKVKALTESERLISETYSSAERDIYIQTVAKLFGVEIRSVKNDVEKMIEKAEKQWRKEESNKVKQEAIGYTDKVNPDFAKAPAVARNEENLLGLLLMYPEHRKAVFDRGLIGADDFITDLNKRIFTYLENAYFNNEDSHFDIDDHFTTDERGRMARMKSVRMELSENGDKVLLDSIDNLKKSVSKKLNEKNSSLDSLLNLIKSKQNN